MAVERRQRELVGARAQLPAARATGIRHPVLAAPAMERLGTERRNGAVAVPPHELLSPFGVATIKFAGKVSVNATPLSATALAAGLVRVKLSVDTPPGTISPGANASLIVGGATTKMLADAVPPAIGK